ncbi:MAG: DNA mismatch repair endonuclease MutL [Acholeplasmatales bacterium]|nr:DNA mismatch repair endonuclease MutL [Acholeplasmatales bacterium]
MGKILKMSPKLANMIAAGEVVERPSSVVKELVENSIDAKSTFIKLYLKNGGIDEIKLNDDGEGMDKDDVLAAFLPHATSKIKNEYDLQRIKTLGFRGEAIASIAEVSNMTITSSTNGIEGYSCHYKYGVKQEAGITNHNKGTTIVVNSLFYNTPARLKYLKPAKTELSSIMFFIDRIAIAHPEIKFSIFSDEKLIFQTTGQMDDTTLMAEVYGKDVAKKIMTKSYVDSGYKVKMLFAKPEIYRSNKLEITMVCNGRYVKNYNITKAVVDGFSTYIPINKYPLGILYFEIDPLLIDVNVHPTKTEIKIANEDAICNKLTSEIKSMLEEYKHIPERNLSEKKGYVKESIFNSNFFLEDVSYPNDLSSKIENNEIKVVAEKPKEKLNTEEFKEIKKENDDYKKTMEIVKDNTEIIIENKIPYMEYVGEIFGTYLIFQNDNGMYLIDQHAAAERINYEYYYEILSNPNYPKTAMLIPDVMTFSKSESLFIQDHLDDFNNIGFTLEQIGPCDFALREIPLWIKDSNSMDAVYDILSMMIDNQKIDIMHFRDYITKQISCKASIKANHRISNDEVSTLLKRLNKCKNPYTCPHGRPTMIKLSISDLEKMFERIQSK